MAETALKALVIAPYERMRTPLMQAAEAFEGRLALDVQIGDLEDGAALAQQLDLSGYDVIISRGGTTELIRPLVELPVVDIAITPYDVLKTLRLAAGHHERYAVVGYPNIT